MHAWAEIDHDLRYKPTQGVPSAEELATLDDVNGLVLTGEIALKRLHRGKIEAMGNAIEFAIRATAGLIPGVHPTEKYLQPLPDNRMGFIFLEQNTLEKIMTTK
jgi:hypothetical protein